MLELADDSTQLQVPAGLVNLVICLVLCFLGVRSLRLTGVLISFGRQRHQARRHPDDRVRPSIQR